MIGPRKSVVEDIPPILTDETLAEQEYRHRSDRIKIGAHRREGGTLGWKLGRQRVLDGRAIGVATRMLWVEIVGAALCERGHRDLDPVHGTGVEHLIVRLRGGRNAAWVEHCE